MCEKKPYPVECERSLKSEILYTVQDTIGSLNNTDGNGSENITKKMNLRPFKLYRVYLEPFNSSNVMLYPCADRERKIWYRMSTSSTKRRIERFHVVVVQWTSKKCTKKRDARAERLFCS